MNILSGMAETVAASPPITQPPAAKAYAVTLRCESLVVAIPGDSRGLPPMPSPCGPLQFFVESEYRPCDDGTPYPTYLLLRTMVRGATSLLQAQRVAQRAASWITSFIALVHNAYVGPAMPWVIYSLEPAGSQRQVHQLETEHRAPLKTRRIIWWDYALMLQFFALPGLRLPQRDGWRLFRSLDMYGIALAEWNVYKMLVAAQWLWLAAEGMTELAVPEYLAERGKSEAEVIAEEMQRLRHQYMPASANEQQIAEMLRIWEQAGGYPAKLRDQAIAAFKSDARRKIIFRGQPDAYRELSIGSTKFEHGNEGPDDMRRRITPHIDAIAACVRNFILRKYGVDGDLFTKLTSKPYQHPVPVADASLNIEAQFRVDGSGIIPTDDPNGAPFELRTVIGPRDQPVEGMPGTIPRLSEKPLFRDGVQYEVTFRNVGYHWEPMSVQTAESAEFFADMEGRV